ncbi:MAG: tRNA lysidine(34) synthetase TilS [Lachnospiraceae bacterium]|nr:tRNA lysidine(34) synthetase TilS [Lachnospiraceae bacterium]
MIQKVQKQIENIQLINANDRVIVAVSGGADSVCLLLMLRELTQKINFSLEAIHVEHGIRGIESKKDAEFVERLCDKLEIPCHVIGVDVPAYSKKNGIGEEESARILRYKAFSDYVRERNQAEDNENNIKKSVKWDKKNMISESVHSNRTKIALAHHMEDNAETILFQLIRGSSLTGMCGICPMRTDENGMTYIRPLLCLRRKEIEAYLREKGQEYCTDSTNMEIHYSRNYLRNVIFPQLSTINSQAVLHMNQTSAYLAEIRDYMDIQVKEAFLKIVTKKVIKERGKASEQLILDTKQLQALHIALQKDIAYMAICEVAKSRKDISLVHVEDLLNLCQLQSGKWIDLPYKILAKKEYDTISLQKQEGCDVLKNVTWEKPVITISKEALDECYHTGNCLQIPLVKENEMISIRVVPYKKSQWILENTTSDFFIGDTQKNEVKISNKIDVEQTNVSNGCVEKKKDVFVSDMIQKDTMELKNKIQEETNIVLYENNLDKKNRDFLKIPKKTYTKWLDYDKIKQGFCIRTRQMGDYFISDTNGHRKKLKQYLIDEKIPASQRDSLWLLTQDSLVLWLVGGRISEHLKITNNTNTIIEIAYNGGR